MAGPIAQDRETCQFPFVLDEKPTVVPVGSAGEQSGGAQEVPYGAVRSNSERATPSARVRNRFSAPQISLLIQSTLQRVNSLFGPPRKQRISARHRANSSTANSSTIRQYWS